MAVTGVLHSVTGVLHSVTAVTGGISAGFGLFLASTLGLLVSSPDRFDHFLN